MDGPELGTEVGAVDGLAVDGRSVEGTIVGPAEGKPVVAAEGTKVGSLVGSVASTVGANEGYLLGRSELGV